MGRMATEVLLRQIHRLVGGDTSAPGSDAELLARYTTAHDETAFAELVRRHGPMVWNTCRRAVRYHHDAEDVFQATFVVLARKAGTERWRASIAPWLYVVAQRLACKARAQAGRRPALKPVEPVAPDVFEEMSARDLLTALDAELTALPARYRGPLILCWLEGQTQEEAARLLDVSLSTLRRRVEDGK